MNASLTSIVILGSLFLSAHAQSLREDAESTERIRHVILGSRHLGAHGLGYNEQSLEILAMKLKSSDIPVLVNLATDKDLRVGAQFALASQCEAGLSAVRDAAADHKMSFLDAEDTMRLVEDFGSCAPEARRRATAMGSEIHVLAEIDQRNQELQAHERAVEDARIQKNGLKMTDPKQAKELSRQEREEVYRRSLKAMGLREDGPMTPAQKDLVDRMYRTMVLGESGDRSRN